MATDTPDTPMEAPAVILVIVASAAVLLLTAFMLIDFVWGPSEAAKVRTAAPAHAAAPATNPG